MALRPAFDKLLTVGQLPDNRLDRARETMAAGCAGIAFKAIGYNRTDLTCPVHGKRLRYTGWSSNGEQFYECPAERKRRNDLGLSF